MKTDDQIEKLRRAADWRATLIILTDAFAEDQRVVSDSTHPGHLCGSDGPTSTTCPPISWCARKTGCHSGVRPVHGRGASVRRAIVVQEPESRLNRSGRARLFQIWDHPSGQYLLESNPNPMGFPSRCKWSVGMPLVRSEEHTSELQSRLHLVCRLLLEKKKN